MTPRLDRISVAEAAGQKGCSRQAVHYAIKARKIDAERIGKVNAVVVNQTFNDWKPNPNMQKGGKARAKKAKKAKR